MQSCRGRKLIYQALVFSYYSSLEHEEGTFSHVEELIMGLINDGVNKPMWEKSLPLFPLLPLNFDDHFPFLIFNNYNNLQHVTLSFIMKHWTARVSDERHFRHLSALYDCNQKQMRRHAFSSHSVTFSGCGVCSRAISGCLQREIRFQHEGAVWYFYNLKLSLSWKQTACCRDQ